METIKASELRIGNRIKQFNYGFYEDEKWKTEDFDIVEVDLVILESISKEDDFSELFEPIPITQELLLEYGFEAKPLDWFVYEEIGVFIDKERNKVRITFEGFFIILNIKYLHELQNAIFALTNKELEKI